MNQKVWLPCSACWTVILKTVEETTVFCEIVNLQIQGNNLKWKQENYKRKVTESEKNASRALRRLNTRHKNPQLGASTLFRRKFGLMFPVFQLAWSSCRATKPFVAGWRKLLRKVERGSTLSNKFWLCCSFFIKLTTCRAASRSKCARVLANQPISALHFFNAQQMFLLRVKLIVQGEKMQNIDQNLQRNNVARQVEGFCISYFATFKRSRRRIPLE